MASHIIKLKTGHEDLVHGIQYDYYGKRLAMCSTDQQLKVWDAVETGNRLIWELNDTWKGHNASVIKAIWAPPEYGQIIASCSCDRTIKIWEEEPVKEPKNSQRRWSERFRLVESKGAVMDIAFLPLSGALRLASCSTDGMVRIYECLEPTNLTQWSLMEEFAIDMGRDSTSSTLESPPPPPPPNIMNATSLLSQQQLLQQHQLQEQHQLRKLQELQQNGTAAQHQQASNSQQKNDISLRRAGDSLVSDRNQIHSLPPPSSSSSPAPPLPTSLSSVSGTRSQPPHLGKLSSPPTASSILQQYQHQQQQHFSLITPGSNSSGASSTIENSQLPFGIHVASTPGLPPPSPRALPDMTPSLAISSLHQHHHHQQQQQQQQQQEQQEQQFGAIETGFCIDWCPNRTSTAMMVVGLGKEHGAKIFKHNGNNRWQPGELLFGHTNQVNDVSWAPSMGRTYQLVATACKDHYVRIFKLTNTNKMTGTRINMLSKPVSFQSSGDYHVEMVAEFGQHQTEVWRVEWNIMGTILSSSDRTGSLRLWKVKNDAWHELATLNTNTSSQQK